MVKQRPRPYRTTYDIGRRRTGHVRLVWVVLAAVLGVVLAFAGIAAVSRAVSSPAGSPAQQPAPATSSSAPPSPTPTLVAPQDQVDELTIQNVAGAFTDAWLQRNRGKRKAQLGATATAELAAALMKTADQNIPRTRKEGPATIDSRVDGLAIVLQGLGDASVLRITVAQTGAAGTWLVSDVDLGEA